MEARQINCLAGSVFRGKENAFQLRCWIRAVCDYRFLGTILLLYSLPSVLEISQSSLSAPFASGWMLPNLHFHQESGLHRLGFYRGHWFQLPPRLAAHLRKPGGWVLATSPGAAWSFRLATAPV